MKVADYDAMPDMMHGAIQSRGLYKGSTGPDFARKHLTVYEGEMQRYAIIARSGNTAHFHRHNRSKRERMA